MKRDITSFIADFVLEADPEMSLRTEYQAAALQEAKCTDYACFGRWVDAYDVKLLLSAFALADKDFAVRFPRMAHITEAQRRKFIDALESHFETCQHCSLKRGYDLEMDARIKKVCQQNNKVLLQLLREEETESSPEGEHLRMTLESAI
jgi:hypothetical protein